MNCRITNSPLETVLDFGQLYVSDFVPSKDTPVATYNLKVGASRNSGIVQLFESYNPDDMYKNYWYNSSINEMMRSDLRDVALESIRRVSLNHSDSVLDIASNSGELLTNYPDSVVKVGVDPCNIARESDLYEKIGATLINDYFKKELVSDRKFKIITCCAMFYDLEDPIGFCEDVKSVLDDEGIFVLQLNHLPTTLEQFEVGNFSQEHIFYYSITSVRHVLRKAGFTVFDIDMNYVNGGSMRLYCHKGQNPSESFMHPLQDFKTASYCMTEGVLYSSSQIISNTPFSNANFSTFQKGLEERKTALHSLINQYKNDRKQVYGYGASTKGNTVLQIFGLNNTHITGIAERYTPKIGLLTAGSWIPIISENELRSNPDSLVLVFPWHFMSAIKKREANLISYGAQFINPLSLEDINKLLKT